MAYWNIDSANGNSITQGIQLESEARRIALGTADRLGESVYLYEVGGEGDDGEGEIESEEIKPISDKKIRALSNEAAEAGDQEQVDLCEAALAGDGAAREACAKAIRAAAAMAD